jgi:hypothetical protein
MGNQIAGFNILYRFFEDFLNFMGKLFSPLEKSLEICFLKILYGIIFGNFDFRTFYKNKCSFFLLLSNFDDLYDVVVYISLIKNTFHH